MAQFQDLSSELVLGILEEVQPDDIVSISLASKTIHQLALPRLDEHRRLQKQYSRFNNMVEFAPNTWKDPGGLLADLLCNIISNTRIGQYIKTIDLEYWNSSPLEGWKPDAVFDQRNFTSKSWVQPCSKTNMEIIEDAVRAAEIIPRDEIDDWLHEIRHGNEDPIVALLLLHAPKLHTLDFIVPYNSGDSSFVLRTIERIVASELPVKLHLSHLRDVRLRFAERWSDLHLVKAFMSLPSLTSILTHRLYVDDRTFEASSARLSRPSNVRDILFLGGYLPCNFFWELLKGVKKLKSFHYNFRSIWREDTYEPPIDSLTIIRSLEANAAHTLERLSLGAYEEAKTIKIALRGFHILRDVSLHSNSYSIIEESRLGDFVSSLPPSLEKLSLSWYQTRPEDSFEALKRATLGFVRESKTHLPRLRRLYLETFDSRESEALWDQLGSDETAQINPKLSFYIRGPDRKGEIGAWCDNECTCGQDCFGNSSS